MKKDKQFSIRISEQDLETIRRKAAQAHMSQSDYVTACCLGKRIVILDGLREVLRQQKAIGNNLNQLAVLANMGKVQFANLDTAAQAHMSQSDYVTACCLGKRIVILDGLKEVLRQQKAIGNNLNQLTVLANMGKVQFANLDTAAQEFAKINVTLRELQEGGRGKSQSSIS